MLVFHPPKSPKVWKPEVPKKTSKYKNHLLFRNSLWTWFKYNQLQPFFEASDFLRVKTHPASDSHWLAVADFTWHQLHDVNREIWGMSKHRGRIMGHKTTIMLICGSLYLGATHLNWTNKDWHSFWVNISRCQEANGTLIFKQRFKKGSECLWGFLNWLKIYLFFVTSPVVPITQNPSKCAHKLASGSGVIGGWSPTSWPSWGMLGNSSTP